MTENFLLRQQILYELNNIVGAENILTDPDDLIGYSYDYYWVTRMLFDRDNPPPLPDYVVKPANTNEVSEVVKLANHYKLPITPFGGGSGVNGGIIPIYGGITIDLKRLNKIINLDKISQTVTVQGGMNSYIFEKELNEQGYTFTNYPASVHSATLAGFLACRGSGTLSTKYGKAEDLVLNVEVVLPNGDIINTIPTPTHAAGPGCLHFFLGAEGSFGIITQATFQIDQIPETRLFHAYLFKSVFDGLEAGREIMLKRLDPSVIRLYDEYSTQTRVKKILNIDVKGAYMVIGFEGFNTVAKAQKAIAEEIIDNHGGEDLGSELGEHWWNSRYDFYFPPKTLDLPWLFGTMDTLTTYDKIKDLYTEKKKCIESDFKDYQVQYLAHFSHWFPWGCMIYDRFIIENPPENATDAFQLHNRIWDKAINISLDHGGAINEHHGVGFKLSRFIRKQYGTSFQLLEGIKEKIDPNNIMNPGKLGFGPTK